MEGRRRLLLDIFGSLLGALLLLVAIIAAVNYLQEGMQQAKEEERRAAVAEDVTTETEEVTDAGPTAEEGTGEQESPPADEAESEQASTEADQPVETVAIQPEPSAPSEVVAAFNKGGCAGCHMIPGIPGANGIVGPDLSTIGVDGASRIDGTAADQYITESIVDPNAFISPECPSGPCPANVMLQTFALTLSPEELDTMVGYLAALGTDAAAELTTKASTPQEMSMSLPAESVLEPFTPLPAEPAQAAQIALGKYLFFDSRLSGNNSLSCASCHQPENAYTDGMPLSKGYPSTNYFRNTPTVMNTVYADYLYWDGRMDGSDMATLVRDHIAEAHFMSTDGRLMLERLNQVPAYVEMFDEVYGSEPSYGRVLNAIAAYVGTLNSPATAYDLYVGGDTDALSEDALAGLELFEGKAQCATCHISPLLTDGQFHNTGVPASAAIFEDPERHLTFRRFFRILGTPNYRNLREDVGLYAMTIDMEDWGKFRTPSLREVDRTAPYMHNGSMETLEDVVRFYNEGGGVEQTAGLAPLDLNDTETAQLVAFLESLSSEPISVERPTLPDYQVMPLGAGTTQ